jgi:hypothetical protein
MPFALTLALLLPLQPDLPLKAVKDKTAVTFAVGGQVVTRYVYAGDAPAPRGTATVPLAKPYFYPLVAPNGVNLTRGWPIDPAAPKGTTDHVHQKSAWFCHGDVIPDGITLKTHSADKHVKGVDFWSEAAGHGRIVCVKCGDPKPTPDGVSVETSNEWRTADGVVILNEDRTITLRTSPGRHTVTVTSSLTTPCGVTFGDTKEGSFGVRIRDDFALNAKGSTGVVTSSDGTVVKAPAKDNLPVWGKLAAWNDYSGTAGGKTAGLTIRESPDNPIKAAWHTRAYGLMAANPFARAGSGFPARKGQTDLVKLAKGATLALSYAIDLHDGPAGK